MDTWAAACSAAEMNAWAAGESGSLMMSGTPVLGTRRGALPEIVSEEAGAPGDTLEDLVRLRASIDHCDPQACRSYAERRFTHVRMAEEYVRMYREYITTNMLPPGRHPG